MNPSKKVEAIQAILNKEFPETPVPLDHQDSYTLLVAVLLSAQCTDKRVNLVTPHLFKKANTPQEMAKLDVKVIEDIIRKIKKHKKVIRNIAGTTWRRSSRII